MNTGKTLFAQLMDFLPWTTFSRASFMLINILATINPPLNLPAISSPSGSFLVGKTSRAQSQSTLDKQR